MYKLAIITFIGFISLYTPEVDAADLQADNIDSVIISRVQAKHPNTIVHINNTFIAPKGVITFDPKIIADLSSVERVDNTSRFYNCSDIDQQETINVTLKTTVGTSIELTRGFSSKSTTY